MSLANYRRDDHVCGHLFTAARAANEPHVEIDVLAGELLPEVFRTPALLEAVQSMRDQLPHAFQSEGSTLAKAQSVRMQVDYKFDDARTSPEVYDCSVEILDDRGVWHKVVVKEWWRSRKRIIDPLGERRSGSE